MIPAVSADLSKRLVPDELWRPVAPLLPSFAARPQDGGTAPRDQRAVFTAVVYVLTSGCAWRHLPPTFGTSSATAHRRFTVWTEVGLWRRLHRAVLDELGSGAKWTGPRRSSTRPPFAPKGGIADRAEPGRSRQEGQQAACAVRCSGRGPRRRRPVKLRGNKAYLSAEHLIWLRERGIVARIARPGIESGERLGRHRWKIERSIAWLFDYRRLTIRYERKGSHFLAFLGLAAALTCYKELAKLAT